LRLQNQLVWVLAIAKLGWRYRFGIADITMKKEKHRLVRRAALQPERNCLGAAAQRLLYWHFLLRNGMARMAQKNLHP
jgi:hypothetical protein